MLITRYLNKNIDLHKKSKYLMNIWLNNELTEQQEKSLQDCIKHVEDINANEPKYYHIKGE